MNKKRTQNGGEDGEGAAFEGQDPREGGEHQREAPESQVEPIDDAASPEVIEEPGETGDVVADKTQEPGEDDYAQSAEEVSIEIQVSQELLKKLRSDDEAPTSS